MELLPPLGLGKGRQTSGVVAYVLHDLVELVVLGCGGIGDMFICNELKELPGGHNVEVSDLAKEVVDVGTILPQEGEGGGMIGFDALRNVDNIETIIVPEKVVFR